MPRGIGPDMPGKRTPTASYILAFLRQIRAPASDDDLARPSAASARGDAAFCPCPSGGHSAMPCHTRVDLLADRIATEGWLPVVWQGYADANVRPQSSSTRGLGKSSKDKSAPTLWVIAFVGLTAADLLLLVLALGDMQDGGTSLPDRSVRRHSPKRSSGANYWSATRVTWATTCSVGC